MDSVVATEAKCQQAASKLGLSYYMERPGERNPAGCYFGRNPSVYFNSIVDPSLTSKLWNSFGAICIAGGT